MKELVVVIETMMKNKIYSLIILLLCSLVDIKAQTFQWANSVIKVSSQRNTLKGGAGVQALGKPNCFPQKESGRSYCVWKPYFRTPNEFLHIGYANPMKIKQVIVAENRRPGALKAVYAYDSLNKEYLLKSFTPKFTDLRKGLTSVVVPETPYKVVSIKLVFDNSGPFADSIDIDAVGISDVEYLPEIKPNVVNGAELMNTPENLGSKVNSKYTELLPVITADGKKLYFSRRDCPENIEGPKDDIWFSEIQADGAWGDAKNVGRPLNNATYNYLSAISPDGNTLLIDDQQYIPGKGQNGLSFVRMTPMGWGFPEKLIIENHHNKSLFNEFSLCNDGKTLLMSLERTETQGAMDIYVSFMKPDGKWTLPKNLGPKVNTAHDDQYPFLAADGVTLYFASNGYSSYGEDDIYMTKRLDDTWQNWSEPQNLGPKINTSGIDLNFTMPASGDYAYLVSDHNSLGGADLFRVKLPEVLKPQPVALIKGKVIDGKTGKPLQASVKYENLNTNVEVGIANSDPKMGNYSIVLPCGVNYGFLAAASGYVSEDQNLDLSTCKGYQEIQKDLVLVPIEVGQKIRLNNLFFDRGKFEIKTPSYAELDRLVAFMKANPLIKIEISGHTDNVGKEVDNQLLSQNRAQAVVDYLKSKGILENRLTAKGYGSTMPTVANDNDEHKAMNRRVEMKILSK